MTSIVCKFGGSSVADAEQIAKVRDIVARNERRRFVVVSAPGRRCADDEKVTDHLLNVATDGAHFWERRKPISAAQSRAAVVKRFAQLVDDLGVDQCVLESLDRDLETDLEGDRKIAFLASRGEHYNAKVIAEHFRGQGLDSRICLPEDFGLTVSGEYLDAKVMDESYGNIARLTESKQVNVVPGYYGITRGGEVAVFSRGGSDLTGGEIAYAIEAETYENWTDVDGVFEADPGIIPEARAIPRLTFKELRLLSSKGFNVFHVDAVLNCRRRKIPISIRNTNRPTEPGTRVLNERVPDEGVVGIARLDNVACIYLEKDTLSEELGFTAKVLRVLQDFRVNSYHYPTDKDDVAVLVDQEDLKGCINDLRRTVEEQLRPDLMDVVYNLAIITPVGLGLKGNSYPMVDAITALHDVHIPIEMIGQSPSQICFHLGVSMAVADEALQILYRALIQPS